MKLLDELHLFSDTSLRSYNSILLDKKRIYSGNDHEICFLKGISVEFRTNKLTVNKGRIQFSIEDDSVITYSTENYIDRYIELLKRVYERRLVYEKEFDPWLILFLDYKEPSLEQIEKLIYVT